MRLVDLLFPERCAVCGGLGEALCDPCRAALLRLRPPLCERCGSPGAWPVLRCAECAGRRLAFASARSAIVYDERARAFVREWKERGRRRLARPAAELVAEVLRAPDVEALVPVPADPERLLERGDAPPDALAAALGRLWGIDVSRCLVRTHATKRQRGLGLRERRRNARGSVTAMREAPRTACLVDDVYTSGATADACASALRRAGARRVEAVTLARAIR